MYYQVLAIDSGPGKAVDKRRTGFVFTDHSDQGYACAESRNVDGTVGCTPRSCLGFLVFEYEHRSFTRNPGDSTVQELVGNEVADNDNPVLRELTDDRSQAVLFFRAITGQRLVTSFP
jgi:hypothetical protein